MKALSLTQPWATLMWLGAKRIETRSWRTLLYPDAPWIALHASKGFPVECRTLTGREPFKSALRQPWQDLPRGAIGGVARLTGCVPAAHLIAQWQTQPHTQWQQEIQFGDYTTGRFCFYFREVIALQEPVAATGALGFWTVPLAVTRAVCTQLERQGTLPEDLC
jgi:hypothetical protein